MGLETGSGIDRTGAGGTTTGAGAELLDGAAGAGRIVAGDAPAVVAGTIRETFFEMNAVDFACRAAPPPGS